MRLAMIIYGSPIDPDVMEVLESLGLESYTKMREVLGKGRSSGPRLDTHIWPGTNAMVMVALSDEKVSSLVDALKPLKERFSHEGLKLYLFSAEEAL
jgi:nitrogen regulatory protein PII